MTEQEFQDLLNKIELIWDDRNEELLEFIELLQFHSWLNEQEGAVSGNAR